MRHGPALAMACVVAARATASAQPAADPRRFDGAWSVALACSGAAEGARGYTWVFPAEIRGGLLHGQYSVPGTSPSLTLDGTIAADGTVSLLGHGLTGNPAASVGRVQAGSPFTIRADGRLETAHGHAVRRGARPCELDFNRS